MLQRQLSRREEQLNLMTEFLGPLPEGNAASILASANRHIADAGYDPLGSLDELQERKRALVEAIGQKQRG